MFIMMGLLLAAILWPELIRDLIVMVVCVALALTVGVVMAAMTSSLL